MQAKHSTAATTKTIVSVGLLLSLMTPGLWGQGVIFFWNATARTHLGSPDGPFAGPGIWGQLLVGTTADSLIPVGMPLNHRINGIVGGASEPNPLVTVPWVGCGASAYVQMVAWDGNLWGTTLAAVPADQLGRTDVILHGFNCFPAAAYAPWFMQSAVVPVPEPSALALGGLSACAGLCWRWGWRRRKAAVT